MVPEPCPNGTYTYPNQGGLRDERECLPCPPGNFCRYPMTEMENSSHMT